MIFSLAILFLTVTICLFLRKSLREITLERTKRMINLIKRGDFSYVRQGLTLMYQQMRHRYEYLFSYKKWREDERKALQERIDFYKSCGLDVDEVHEKSEDIFLIRILNICLGRELN